MDDLKSVTVRYLRELARKHLGRGQSTLRTREELIAALRREAPGVLPGAASASDVDARREAARARRLSAAAAPRAKASPATKAAPAAKKTGARAVKAAVVAAASAVAGRAVRAMARKPAATEKAAPRAAAPAKAAPPTKPTPPAKPASAKAGATRPVAGKPAAAKAPATRPSAAKPDAAAAKSAAAKPARAKAGAAKAVPSRATPAKAAEAGAANIAPQPLAPAATPRVATGPRKQGGMSPPRRKPAPVLDVGAAADAVAAPPSLAQAPAAPGVAPSERAASRAAASPSGPEQAGRQRPPPPSAAASTANTGARVRRTEQSAASARVPGTPEADAPVTAAPTAAPHTAAPHTAAPHGAAPHAEAPRTPPAQVVAFPPGLPRGPAPQRAVEPRAPQDVHRPVAPGSAAPAAPAAGHPGSVSSAPPQMAAEPLVEGFFVARVAGEEEARRHHLVGDGPPSSDGDGEALGDLPWSYGNDAVVLLPRDPGTVLVFWDFSAAARERALDGLDAVRAALRVFDGQGLVREVECALESRSYYIHGLPPGRTYRVEAHVVGRDGRSRRIGPSSGRVALPPAGPSDDTTVRFLRVPLPPAARDSVGPPRPQRVDPPARLVREYLHWRRVLLPGSAGFQDVPERRREEELLAAPQPEAVPTPAGLPQHLEVVPRAPGSSEQVPAGGAGASWARPTDSGAGTWSGGSGAGTWSGGSGAGTWGSGSGGGKGEG